MKVILVAGATGQQGGSVIRALSDSENYLCLALTRNPDSSKALKLKSFKNVELVAGDLNDIQQLRSIFENAKSSPTGAIWGVFVALEYPGLGGNAEGEERQGKNLATVAHEFQVQSYIYTSSCLLPFPDNKPPIPKTTRHSKLSIESHISSLDMPWTLWKTLADSAEPSLMQNPLKFNHKIIDVANAGLTQQDRNETFLKAAGYDIPSAPSFIITSIYWMNIHVQNMIGDFVQSDDLRKLDPRGYDANIQEGKSHMKLVSFEEWARRLNRNADGDINEHGVTLWGLLTRRT
ncbi:unnamed protein product [Rhizoctonia solani]|uniref:NmrA-like domain-containing protein n=1 Tax=Rhizoctonia solani TaxID=456999 RepID=A0A8H3GZZ7_9AGAM|nr:unnamed protein product [Rhizoctonia solani]